MCVEGMAPGDELLEKEGASCAHMYVCWHVYFRQLVVINFNHQHVR